MRYKIVGEMGIWEQTSLKNDINGTLIDYKVLRGSVIVEQIYDCSYINQSIKDKYSYLKFSVISSMSDYEEKLAICDIVGCKIEDFID